MTELKGRPCKGTQVIAKIIAAGPAGKSAYAYAVEGGYQGSEQQFYLDLANAGSGVAGVFYIAGFTESDFSPQGARSLCLIKAQAHGLGYRVAVKEIVRQREDGFGNILCQYRILLNGDIAVYSDEPFAGRAVIEKI